MQGTRLDVTDLHPLRWLPDVANEVNASLNAVDHGTNSRMRMKPTSKHGRCTSHRSSKTKVYCQ